MLAKHHDLAITPQQRFRFASLMSLAADDAGLPDDPEFRSAFVAYVEWGNAARAEQLATRRQGRRARAGPTLGLGRGAAVRAVALSQSHDPGVSASTDLRLPLDELRSSAVPATTLTLRRV